jgi:hypothetical protein
VTTFIKAFVDFKSTNNDAALGSDVFPTLAGRRARPMFEYLSAELL